MTGAHEDTSRAAAALAAVESRWSRTQVPISDYPRANPDCDPLKLPGHCLEDFFFFFFKFKGEAKPCVKLCGTNL